jgi:alanine dehydrogenase
MIDEALFVGVPDPVLLLDRTEVARHLTLDSCITAVEAAFAADAQGNSFTPGLLHVEAKDGEFHIKAGGLAGTRAYFTCKVNGGFFGNRVRHQLPNILGLIVLCNGSTGAPVALMESGVITRLRTGAATAVAAKYLARTDSRTVTICGAGSQGEIQLRALSRVLPLTRAYIWSPSSGAALAERMRRDLNIDVQVTSDLGAALRVSDVIVTCTPAKRWYVAREHVSPGTFIAAVGADSPEKQELEPALLAASSVVTDLRQQAVHVGDLHHAIAAGLMKPQDIRGELGAVIIGEAPRRTSADEIIVFDSTGTALQDTAAAALVYEQAVSSGKCHFAFWN